MIRESNFRTCPLIPPHIPTPTHVQRACPSSLVIRVGLAGPDGHLASMLSYSCLVPVLETGASAAEASIHPELCTDLAHLLGTWGTGGHWGPDIACAPFPPP